VLEFFDESELESLDFFLPITALEFFEESYPGGGTAPITALEFFEESYPGGSTAPITGLEFFEESDPGCGASALDFLDGGVFGVALLLLLFVDHVQDGHFLVDFQLVDF